MTTGQDMPCIVQHSNMQFITLLQYMFRNRAFKLQPTKPFNKLSMNIPKNIKSHT